MLLNRESNPGLPRLVVSNHMTTEIVISGLLGGKRISVAAYAEIIATRPLGIVTNCDSLMVVFHGETAGRTVYIALEYDRPCYTCLRRSPVGEDEGNHFLTGLACMKLAIQLLCSQLHHSILFLRPQCPDAVFGRCVNAGGLQCCQSTRRRVGVGVETT
jgi:hypothetical protein